MSEIKFGPPKGETSLVRYFNMSGELRYILTTNIYYDAFYLYELSGDKFIKLGKAKTPVELEKKYEIIEKLKEK